MGSGGHVVASPARAAKLEVAMVNAISNMLAIAPSRRRARYFTGTRLSIPIETPTQREREVQQNDRTLADGSSRRLGRRR